MFSAIVFARADKDCGLIVDLSFPSALLPVSQRLRESLIRERVIEQLIDHLKRHGGDI